MRVDVAIYEVLKMFFKDNTLYIKQIVNCMLINNYSQNAF